MASLPSYLDDLTTTFASDSGRLSRYELLLRLYNNTAYSGRYVSDLIDNLDLYKYIRGLYNPAYRLASFYGQHIFNGNVDYEAGNGQDRESMLPIIDASSSVRTYISKLFKNTNLISILRPMAEWGARDGDAYIAVNKNPNGSISYELLRPTELKELELNSLGQVIYYKLERTFKSRKLGVTKYVEVCTLNDDGTVDYDISGFGVEPNRWTLDLGFIPVVHIAHTITGTPLGLPEITPSLTAAIELDDSGSKIFDQVRQMVNPAWLFAGVRKPVQKERGTVVASEQDITAKTYQKAYYSNDASARAYPLVADLDIEGAIKNLDYLLNAVSLNHPELRVAEGLKTSGDLSGRAIITNRSDATQRILRRRDTYDRAAKELICMAYVLDNNTIIDPAAPVHNALEFLVGNRPVFSLTEAERLENEKAFLINAGLAARIYISPDVYMKMSGRSKEQIDLVVNSDMYKAYMARINDMGGDGFGLALDNRAGEDSFGSQREETSVSEPNKPFNDYESKN